MHSDIAEGRARCRLLRELVLEAGQGGHTVVRQADIICEIAAGAVADNFYTAEIADALRLMHELSETESASADAESRSHARTLVDDILEAIDLMESRLEVIERMRRISGLGNRRNLRPGGGAT